MARHDAEKIWGCALIGEKSPSACMSAMERSPINDLEIKTLPKSALTGEISSREVYMKGLDRSYCYESPRYVD
jgi:hypothetical protein